MLHPLESRRLLDALVEEPSPMALGYLDVSYLPTIFATSGDLVDGVVSNFRGDLAADQYKASIAWGDGSRSAGTLQPQADGSYSVLAQHRYAQSGEFEAHVEINGSDRSFGIDYRRIFTGAPQLVVTSDPIPWIYRSDNNLLTYIGSFFDQNPVPESQYKVNIDWGDGSTSAGQAVWNYEGGFDVIGEHAFPAIQSYKITFTVEKQGDILTATGWADVGPIDLEEAPIIEDAQAILLDTTIDELSLSEGLEQQLIPQQTAPTAVQLARPSRITDEVLVGPASSESLPALFGPA